MLTFANKSHNTMANRIFSLLLLLCAGNLIAQNTSVTNIEPRVEALLAKMTVEEKIGQLTQMPGDISTGTVICRSRDRVTPPSTNSRSREWP